MTNVYTYLNNTKSRSRTFLSPRKFSSPCADNPLSPIGKHYFFSLSWFCHVFKVLVAQSHPTLCEPMDCSTPGSSVLGILQAITLEWFATPFSRGSSQSRGQTRVSCTADSSPSWSSLKWKHTVFFWWILLLSHHIMS